MDMVHLISSTSVATVTYSKEKGGSRKIEIGAVAQAYIAEEVLREG